MGNSEVLDFNANAIARPRLPQIHIDTDSPVNSAGPDEEALQPEPVSPLRRGSHGGLWHRLSPRSNSVSSVRTTTLQAQPSFRSQVSVRSSRSSLWSLRRSIRRPRAPDVEEGGADTDGGLPHDQRAELEGVARQIGPFELYSLTREERRAVLAKPPPPPPLPASGPAVASHRAIVETLFGRKLCGPQYLGLRRVYMAQVDKKLTAALRQSDVANPNPAVWPKPFAYLVGFLGLVSRRITPKASVASFVLAHRAEFESMIRHGIVPPTPRRPRSVGHTDSEADSDSDEAVAAAESAAAAGVKDVGGTPAAGATDLPGELSPWHRRIVYEWMQFSLEAWMMVDLQLSSSATATATDLAGWKDLETLPQFCGPPIGQLVGRLLPPPPRAPYSPYSPPSDASIQRHEVSASILHEWKAFSFKWTQDIAEHLRLDSQEKVVWIYANVAFCHLHAIAKENSSLKFVRPP